MRKKIVIALLLVLALMYVAARIVRTPAAVRYPSPTFSALPPTTSALAVTPFPTVSPTASLPPATSVGYLMKYKKVSVNKLVSIKGYMIARESGYVIFSDEKVDTPNPNDLPVTGLGIGQIKPLQAYILTGRLVLGGLTTSNKNPYHFELTQAPVEAK